MVKKRNSQPSHKPYFDSKSERGELHADFAETLTEWDCEERTIVSTALKNDPEIIEQYAEAEALRVLIEDQMKQSDETILIYFQAYVFMMQELIGTVASLGDMAANDALIVKRQMITEQESEHK